ERTVSRRETAELHRRLLDSESRNQQLADSVAMATRPLQRQLETLQAALSSQQHSWERAERSLTEKNVDLQRQLASVTERERHVSDQYVEAAARQAPLEASLAELKAERGKMADKLTAVEARAAETVAALERCRSERAASERQLAAQLTELRVSQDELERQLAAERAALTAERSRTAALQEQVQERGRQLSHSQSVVESVTSQLSTPRTSPTPSLSRISFSSSMHELAAARQATNADSVFDSATPRASAGISLYDSVRAAAAGPGGASVVESLTSQLKQRDGEVAQLRSERSDLELARQQLSAELARVSAQLETASEAGRRLQAQTAEYQQLQATYNALLQMYGEKAEESEELKLDLADVKEMYKQQIDQLTKRGAGGGGSS
ncbi:TATA element modulatory factor-like, partial [Amphibalanus amphitrite]|uniref:TATA element modulatory factor-like n=1 Tax=Amphibalanus amphitrite TaxID=1232801 RepID=UPI001C91E54C